MRRSQVLQVFALSLVLVAFTGGIAESQTAAPKCFGKRATIVGTRKADVLRGTGRADVIVALGGADTIRSRGGADLICAGSGHDVVFSGGGSDTIDGQGGNDRISTGGGFDLVFPNSGNDNVSGGDAFDWVSLYTSSGPVNINLMSGSATGEGTDKLIGIEGIAGSAYSDTLVGDNGDNWLEGFEGDDAIDGSGGIDGVEYFEAFAAVTVDLTAGTGVGVSEGADTLTNIEDVSGTEFADTLTGDAGSNMFWGNGDDDTIDGAAGQDAVSYYYSRSAVTVDLTVGSATGEGTDTLTNIEDLFGSWQGDTLTGSAAANYIVGNPGDDVIAGGDGDDTLWGGAGNDTTDGGNGSDACDGEVMTNCETIPSRAAAARPFNRAGALSHDVRACRGELHA